MPAAEIFVPETNDTMARNRGRMDLSWQMNYAGLLFIKPVRSRNTYGSKPSVAGGKPAFICQDAQALATEGFVFMSTSKLQRRVSELLSIHLGQFTIRENIRPDWLLGPNGERLELDFYIEELGIAIEVQGQQHYVYVPYFHGDYDGFRRRLILDRTKKEICEEFDIRLVEIENESSSLDLILSLKLPTMPSSPTVEIDETTTAVIDRLKLKIEKTTKAIHTYDHNVAGIKRREMGDRIKAGHDQCRDLVANHYRSILNTLGEIDTCKILEFVKKTNEYVESINAERLAKRAAKRIRKEKGAKERGVRRENKMLFDGKPSPRVRKQAHKLSVDPVSLFCFRVWGGEREHVISIDANGFICDCEAFVFCGTKVCSHIASVKLYINGLLNNPGGAK
jgi:hypothetical protein